MLTPDEVLELLPQKRPFRFVDRLIRLDENGAVGEYTFRDDESFYPGHFPGNPVTPGVILTEAMCQTGIVALGIYLLGMAIVGVYLVRIYGVWRGKVRPEHGYKV